MAVELWFAFIFTSSLILIVPGPTIIFVISQSMIYGKKSILPLVTGVVAGDIVCMAFSLLGLGALLAISATLFSIVKYLGAAYLIWLGITMLRERNQQITENAEVRSVEKHQLFRKTLTITALNPKGIIFFSAFMPQFIDTTISALPQLAILAVTFLFLAFINSFLYAFLAERISLYFSTKGRKKWFNITGGTTLVGAGVVTATAKYN